MLSIIISLTCTRSSVWLTLICLNHKRICHCHEAKMHTFNHHYNWKPDEFYVWGKCISLLTPLDLKKKSHQQREITSSRLCILLGLFIFIHVILLSLLLHFIWTYNMRRVMNLVYNLKRSHSSIYLKRKKYAHGKWASETVKCMCENRKSFFFLSFCTFFSTRAIKAHIPKSLFFHLSFISAYSSEYQPREIRF